MLLKIFKYDFKTNARSQIPVLIALAAATAIACAYVFIIFTGDTSTDVGTLSTIFGVLGLISIVFGIFAASLVSNFLLYLRFYKSMVTDEGYLTLTLPVNPRSLIAGKLLSALLWSAIVTAATFGAFSTIASIFGSSATESISEFVKIFGVLFGELLDIMGENIGIIILWSLQTVVVWVAGFMEIFFAIIFAGCIVKKLKALCAIGLIVGFNSAVSTISFIINAILSLTVFANMDYNGVVSITYSGVPTVYSYIVDIVLYAILGVVFFWLSTFLVKKKVNLD